MSGARKWWLPWERRYVGDDQIVPESIVAVAPTPPPKPDLPDGLWEQNGRLMYECRACERAVELECDPSEFDPETAYCGGSSRCLP